MRILEDALRRSVAVPPRPLRIVSLVPSLTELVCDLGAGDRLIGVSRYCTEPATIATLPRVGGQKDPDLDAIAALRPDLVLAVKEENHKKHVEALEARGIAVYVAEVRDLDDALGLPGEIGDLIDAEPRAVDEILGAMRAGIDRARALAPRRPVRVFCPVWREPWIVVGVDTYAHDVLVACGGLPVMADHSLDRYPRVRLDDVRAAGPEVVLLPDEPYAFGPSDVEELSGMGPARAVVHPIDGKLIAWYGRRAVGIDHLARLFADVAAGRAGADVGSGVARSPL